MSMFERFARDLSESLFDSIYVDMFKIASDEQASIYRNGKKNYHVGEAQETFNAFCHNKLSLGDALEFVKIRKAYR